MLSGLTQCDISYIIYHIYDLTLELVDLLSCTQAEQPDVDCDEVAWEVEKVQDHHHLHLCHHHHRLSHHYQQYDDDQVLTYHCVLTSAQRLLNPEGGMARRGAEAVSRKVL